VELLADYRAQIRYNTYRSDTTVANGLLALAALRTGDATTALDLTRTAITSLLSSPPNLYYAMWSISGCCEVALTLAADRATPEATRRESLQLAEHGCRILQRMSWIIPIIGGRAALHRGQLAVLRGKRARARKLWHAGLASARKYRLPLEEGLLLVATAEDRIASSEDASGILGSAISTLTRIGAQYDLARARRLARDAPATATA
jgi:hypothetical protein